MPQHGPVVLDDVDLLRDGLKDFFVTTRYRTPPHTNAHYPHTTVTAHYSRVFPHERFCSARKEKQH